MLSVLGAETQTVLWKSSMYFSPWRHCSSAKEESFQSLMEGSANRKEKSQEVGKGVCC